MFKFSDFLSGLIKPKSFQDYYVAGLNLIIEENYDEAIDCLTKCVKLNTEIVDAYFRLGQLYYRKEDYKVSAKLYSDLLLRPNLTKELKDKAEQELVFSYSHLKAHKQILSVLKEKDFKKKDNPLVAEKLLEAYEALEMWDQAMNAYKMWSKVFIKKDDAILARIKLGKILSNKEENVVQTVRSLKAFLKEFPVMSQAYIRLNELLEEQEEKREKLKVWEGFLFNCPDEAIPLLNEIESDFYEVDSYGEFVDILKRISHSADSTHPGLLYKYAQCLKQMGMDAELEDTLDVLAEAVEAQGEHTKLLVAALGEFDVKGELFYKIQKTIMELMA